MRLIRFDVIDNQTGKYPDCEKIALSEEWAKHLIYCDIDCFAITEEGDLILIDDCNNIAYPPSDRFTVTIDPASLRPKGEWIYNTDEFTPKKRCTHCGYNKPIAAGLCIEQEPENFCPNCGADMRKENNNDN